MRKVLIEDLFDVSVPYLKDLFDGVIYPWTVLPKLKEYISCLKPQGFTEYAKGVYIGENVKIHSSVVFEGPAIIGGGTEIRPNAYIRGYVITGENCVIGNSTEVKNSILLNHVQIPHYNYVGDSVLGNYSHMGAGSICSNLKADGTNVVVHGEINIKTSLRKLGAILGDYANIGCNCVLNPGTVIGKNTSVYPGVVLRGVIPADCIVKSQINIINKQI